jgi:hypothetical protein
VPGNGFLPRSLCTFDNSRFSVHEKPARRCLSDAKPVANHPNYEDAIAIMPHGRGALKARTELQEADTGTAPGAGDRYCYLVPGKSYNKKRGDARAYVSCSPTQRFRTKKQDRPPKANRPDLPNSA